MSLDRRGTDATGTTAPADETTPEYVYHADGEHSHTHTHGALGAHSHRHAHDAGEQDHTHDQQHPLHPQHPDHPMYHPGG